MVSLGRSANGHLLKNPNGHLQKASPCAVVPKSFVNLTLASLTICPECHLGPDSKRNQVTGETLNGSYVVPYFDCVASECQFRLVVEDVITRSCFPISDTTCTGTADCSGTQDVTIIIDVDPVNDDVTNVNVSSNSAVLGLCCNTGGFGPTRAFLGTAGGYAFGAAIANEVVLANCDGTTNRLALLYDGTATVTK